MKRILSRNHLLRPAMSRALRERRQIAQLKSALPSLDVPEQSDATDFDNDPQSGPAQNFDAAPAPTHAGAFGPGSLFSVESSAPQSSENAADATSPLTALSVAFAQSPWSRTATPPTSDASSAAQPQGAPTMSGNTDQVVEQLTAIRQLLERILRKPGSVVLD